MEPSRRSEGELPSGTVTFLLTDVEGSTALWEQAPEPMRAGARPPRCAVRSDGPAHGGVHIRPRGEGDSRFAVFASAPTLCAAALAIQQTLAAEPWPTPRPISVRIGLHTGEAELRDGDYYGSAVNRCARLRNIGHGGQTLLSEATAVLVRDGLSAETSLPDLGEHRLKDLTRPNASSSLGAWPAVPTSRLCARSTLGRTTCRSSRRAARSRARRAGRAASCCCVTASAS